MNDHALEVLEFRAVLRSVAARAASEAARQRLLALSPGRDPSAVRAELERVAEVLGFLQGRPSWTPPVPPDARAALAVLRIEGGVLAPDALLLVGRTLTASRLLREALDPEASPEADDEEDAGAPGPHLADLRARLLSHPPSERLVEGIVTDEGEVRDDASPALRSIRGRLRGLRNRIVRRLEALAASLPERIRVPDASVSVREGHYVIPIRREGKSEVGGVIHGESATGQTLFVEPPVALAMMAELRGLEREEQAEVQRILRDVSGRLRPVAEELGEAAEALVDFDSLHARARTALRWDAGLPEVAGPDTGELRIVGGRHPLLLERELGGEGDPVVPFDLALAPDERALVVSGPNTGGKTVLLKAVGLIHLLAQAGILPPARPGTRLPVLLGVFADIGDEQSIAESLSTFSAHLSNALEILEGAGPGSLVLMDEMGTGTDPSEGAALARALLEVLVERGARVLATSHLGALKRLDREGSGIVNASLLFDARRIAPTYQLEKGRPGRSWGLAVARRLGIPGAVLERAESYVDSGELEVEHLLATLEARERELSRALARAELDREVAASLRTELEQREAALNERERTAEVRAREDARRLLMEARGEVEAAIRELRSSSGPGESSAPEDSERAARRRVEEAARRQRERTAGPRSKGRRDAPRRGAIEPGRRVRVVGSGAKGVVQELRDDRVTVEVGALRLQLPLGGVEPIEGEEKREAPLPGGKRRGGGGGGWSGPELDPAFEVDLRGRRVEEIDLELGRALDAAVVGGLRELRIIHGKGTGALRARVGELLEADRRVGDFRGGKPGEGGAGVTIALLGEGP